MIRKLQFMRKAVLAWLCVAGLGCSAQLDGPTPAISSVVSDTGSNVICTCADLDGCERGQPALLTISGAGFAPLPVNLLEDQRRIELPTVILRGGGQDFTIHGDDPAQNAPGVILEYTSAANLLLTLPQSFVKDFAPGLYAVLVKNPNENEQLLPDGLEVVLGPQTTGIAPEIICNEVDSTVTISGENFRAGAEVVLGEALVAAEDVRFIDDQTIEITVRRGVAEGSYDLTVINPEGCESTSPTALAVVPPPTLISSAPPTVCTGGTLTLTGEGFLPGATVTIADSEGTSVDVEDIIAVLEGTSVEITDSTTLTVNIGPLPPGGPYDVLMTNANGCSSEVLLDSLTVEPGPIVVAVDPSVVYNGVAFPIAIFGTGFSQNSSASVAGQALTVLEVSVTGDRIDAEVPAGITPGTYDLVVQDPAGCSYTLEGAITVTDQLTVAICDIDPPFGFMGERTAVTITSGASCAGGTQLFASTPRSWLNINGHLKALRSVAFVTATSLTGAVEAGLEVGGPYDLLIQNPDGQIGMLEQAFTVVDLPVPLIEAINPSSVDTKYVGSLTLMGQDFRAPVTVELISPVDQIALSTPVVSNGGTQIDVPLDAAALLLDTGAYLIRVTNTDQGTYSDFSALAVTNPAGNLEAWTDASPMTTARRHHAMVAGRVSTAARFLYAIGGDGGSATPAEMASVELVPLDKFGNTGSWFTQRHAMLKARTGLSAFIQGRYLYVIGGEDSQGPMTDISRALILSPEEAPEIDQFTFVLGGNLAKGAWYYRVSATLPATDPLNPGGETLPSDVVVIQAIAGVKVSLSWTAVPGAESYNVYRTPAPNGAFGGEQLLAEGILITSFDDPGDPIQDAGQTPLRQGETGVFMSTTISPLTTARSNAAAILARDPTGALFVYVAGGRSDATTILSSVEYATVSEDGATLGTFTQATAGMDVPRERQLIAVGHHDTSPAIPAGTTYLYVAGGSSDGGQVLKTGYASSVATGGNLGPFTLVNLKNMQTASVSYMVNDTLYYFGGSANGTTASATSRSAVLTTPLPELDNSDALGPGAIPVARMNSALALESAYFYLSGGGASDTEATTSVIQTIY